MISSRSQLRIVACLFASAVLACDATESSGNDAATDSVSDVSPDVTTGPIEEGLRATINGELVIFDQNPVAGNDKDQGVLTNTISIAGSTVNPTRGLTIGRADQSGTSSCGSPSATFKGRTMAYQAAGIQALGVPNGECTITVTETAAAVGDYYVGTFSGRLPANGGFVAVVTNGSFRLKREY